jgi:hypothetical protein
VSKDDTRIGVIALVAAWAVCTLIMWTGGCVSTTPYMSDICWPHPPTLVEVLAYQVTWVQELAGRVW